MPTVRHPATVILSIDIDAGLDRDDAALSRQVDAHAAALARQLTTEDLAATWAATDLAACETVEYLARHHAQELAVLADGSWAGAEAPRAKFAAALARRLDDVPAAAHTPHTLVMHDAGLPADIDVLIKHGIKAVRTSPPAPAGVRRGGWLGRIVSMLKGSGRRAGIEAQPRTVRWGVWELSATHVLPECGLRRTLKCIDRAIADGAMLHLVVDVMRMVGDGAASVSVTDKLVRHLTRGRDEGVLHVETVSGVVERQMRSLQGRPARSILKHAA